VSSLFNAGRQGFLDGSIDWDNDDVKAMLVKSSWVVDATLIHVSELSSHDNGRSGSLTGKTTTGGVADADNVTITAVDGEEVGFLVLFQDTGVDNTSRLIGYIDTAPEFPFTPAPGQNVAVTWQDGADKIFRL
jgi:phage tail sheath gpL-like